MRTGRLYQLPAKQLFLNKKRKKITTSPQRKRRKEQLIHDTVVWGAVLFVIITMLGGDVCRGMALDKVKCG